MTADRVIVLGAGASRGAAWPDEARPSCEAPLNADFFTQLQRITEPKHRSTVESLISDVVDLFGSNFSLTLEEYFTQLEFLIQAVDIASRHGELQRAELVEKRGHLMAALASVLEASTADGLKKGGCERHAELVRNIEGGDAIITFNYDCIVDDSLRRYGDGKWNARWGYGFPLRGYELVGEEYWNSGAPATTRDATVSLLKLHGSLNWQLPEKGKTRITLKQRLHQQRGVPRFTIIPPVWNKPVATHTVFKRIWQDSAAKLRAAKVVALIGFSFVPTDLYAQSLFRIALQKRANLRRLVIANPDGAARQRIRSVFEVPLSKSGVLVRQYDYFEDFASALPEALG